MHPASIRTAIACVATLATCGAMPQEIGQSTSWLDSAAPSTWNTPGQAIPTAPKIESAVDPRCRELARPQQLTEDARVRERGWDLVGAFQGGWDIVVIGAAAGYDGMCRPLQYQHFVFVRGVFAGTLSPEPMNSRSDGAIGQVWLRNQTQLTAEYSRYRETDALCCPSARTAVVFEIEGSPPTVRPVSVSTSRPPSATESPRSDK